MAGPRHNGTGASSPDPNGWSTLTTATEAKCPIVLILAQPAAIAKLENVDRSYISRLVNLTTLAPDIQAAILDETLPESASLFDLAVDTPLSWEEQRLRIE